MRKDLKTNRGFTTCISKFLFYATAFISPKRCEGEVQVTVLVTQSCPALCGLWTVHSLGPLDGSLPGSSVHRILQARIPEWGAIPFSGGSSRPRDRTRVSLITGRLFTVSFTREAPRILEWVAIPFPGVRRRSPTLQADTWPYEPAGKHQCSDGGGSVECGN